MNRRQFLRTAGCAALGGATGAFVSAQTPAARPPGSILRQIVPNPSGDNGYEDLVLAGEFSVKSKVFTEAQQAPTQTLAMKRRVLSDPDAQRALLLLRRALAKPIRSPYTKVEADTSFPQFSLFRNLARLLALEIYVLFADGKTGQALDDLRDGLKLGYVIQTETLIGGLVGVVIHAIVLQSFAEHLGQLSVRDCERLMRIAREWMDLPDPALRVMEGERDVLLNILERYRADPRRFLAEREEGESDDEEEKRLTAELRTIAGDNPSALNPIFDQCTQLIRAHFDRLLASYRLPYWERMEIETPPGNTIAERMSRELLPVFTRVGDRFTQTLAQVQLLGRHAAIRRYRWEYNRLPDSLDALKLGRLAVDPFTGQAISYRRTGETAYELFSAGPYDRGTDERPPSGERVPVYLPRKR